MWDAFVDAWAIAAGAVPAPPQPSEELQRAGRKARGAMCCVIGYGDARGDSPKTLGIYYS